MNTQLVENLTALSLKPSIEGEALQVELGQGLMRREATLNTTVPAYETDLRSWSGQAARGVLAALSEPPNSRGSKLDFVDAASRIFMSLEGPGFFEGAESVLGEPVWSQDFQDGLKLAFRLELDNGQRLLPVSQVEEWGVHADRVYKAAVSIVFHRSGHESWKRRTYDDLTVDEFRKGDGCDAARGVILDLIDFHRSRAGIYFACPTSDQLIFTDARVEDLDSFATLTKRLFAESAFPLSNHVFGYSDGKLDPTPIRR